MQSPPLIPGVVGPSHPGGKSPPPQSCVDLPSGPYLHQALCPFTQANGRGTGPEVWPRRHPTAMALPRCLGLQAHSVSGFVLGKQKDETALRPRSQQDRTSRPSLFPKASLSEEWGCGSVGTASLE